MTQTTGNEIGHVFKLGTKYSDAMKAELHRPKWLLVAHMFNHQTHHRGQVHCMLTQAGGKPGDTDLPFMAM